MFYICVPIKMALKEASSYIRVYSNNSMRKRNRNEQILPITNFQISPTICAGNIGSKRIELIGESTLTILLEPESKPSWEEEF